MNEDISQDEIQARLRERFSVSPVTLSCGVPELTSAQRTCLAHAVRILSDRRAVLLCEPTGTGKTYIAAALADYALHHGMADAVQIIGPAHLASLWLGVMAQFRIPSDFFSYQMASLDRIPLPKKRTLFLLDEAHYRRLALGGACKYQRVERYWLAVVGLAVHSVNPRKAMRQCR